MFYYREVRSENSLLFLVTLYFGNLCIPTHLWRSHVTLTPAPVRVDWMYWDSLAAITSGVIIGLVDVHLPLPQLGTRPRCASHSCVAQEMKFD